MPSSSELHEADTSPLGGPRPAPAASRQNDLASREKIALLEKQNGELSVFVHTVAHSLKEPLSVIIGTSDAIFHFSDLTPEELHSYLQQIESTAHMMNDLIDHLLLLAEVEDAHVPIEPLAMETIVSHVQTRLGHLVRQYDAHITSPKTWPAAMGYGPWIEEVWSNLISNGVKYGGQPPHVELGAVSRPDGMVLFWTRDNGKGISLQAQANLFRPFNQPGPVRTPGHGLGLSIVRRIVEKLGGQVGVETEAGRGSQFFFTLPARM